MHCRKLGKTDMMVSEISLGGHWKNRGGSLFKIAGKFPVVGVGSKEENDLARLTLQAILTNDAISATVPGLTTVYEVENAARASYQRLLGMTPRQREWLARMTDDRWEQLPEEPEVK
ncbi:MAG: hypothetical protein V3R99_05535 [Thermoguttaceae bacterium]